MYMAPLSLTLSMMVFILPPLLSAFIGSIPVFTSTLPTQYVSSEPIDFFLHCVGHHEYYQASKVDASKIETSAVKKSDI
jgi:hypothetical protein